MKTISPRCARQTLEPIRAARRYLAAAALALASMLYPPFATATAAPADAASVTELMTRDLIGARGKEVRMISVTYLPGAASMPHRHDAQVFVYVLEGELKMQIKGRHAVTLKAGDTFYEGPDDVHEVSANASATAPAKILVLMVKDKAKPPSRDVGGGHNP